jgi:hypothetical protein
VSLSFSLSLSLFISPRDNLLKNTREQKRKGERERGRDIEEREREGEMLINLP